ncbi:FT-interacting protein 1-like [Chenopodium quinoa]|uniref:C2 domain-containing protein n=1 Tax=Chenopodium quinoa TaxID=63459 RepID=A0A803MYK2_CHEQI|nr:FT-interacting protein 1-like [Chenopodium quinoa]
MESATKTPQEAFLLKETRPPIGATMKLPGYEGICSYDLVEQMEYIFVHVVKAVDLPTKDASNGNSNLYAEVKLGDYKATTRHVKDVNPQWDQVFAFSKDQVRASIAEVVIKDKTALGDEFIGKLPAFDLNQTPKCNRQIHLAPQWYKLVGIDEDAARGELLLGIWMGTQADKIFPQACHSDAASIAGEYLLPKLWYVRVNVIEAQDLVLSDSHRLPKLQVLAVIGNQTFRTTTSAFKGTNPMWNEDLLFIAAEPFEEHLVLTVEDIGGLGRHEILGRCMIPLQQQERRLDQRPVVSRWFSLSRAGIVDESRRQGRFSSRIHLRICLEGGYHVLSEATNYCSDLKPTGKQLWRAPIGILEVGVISAHGLMPMRKKNNGGRTDAYCVAKYGTKWVRTRTITDSSNPKWNEQHRWEVFDPFTVITIAVFDDYHFHDYGGENDSGMGKVRIRVSTLESGQINRHRYPLLVLHSSGVEMKGEIELVVRFTCTSWINMLQLYSRPLLPKMHYIYPLSVRQLDTLRDIATQIISNRLGKAEPPLRKEIVDYMLDVDLNIWSLRKSMANFLRFMNFLRWFDQIYKWERPFLTIFFHILLTTLLLYPKALPSIIFFSLFLISIWNYRWRRAWHPPHMDSHLSLGDIDDPDDLDEEFDTFPTSQPSYIVKMRYDRLRSKGSRIQAELEEWATIGERFQSLITWADPRATPVFLLFCICTSVLLYFIEFRIIAAILGFYLLRHPWLRIIKFPKSLVNFFTRLPSKDDFMYL